jgi:hypothetical protein
MYEEAIDYYSTQPGMDMKGFNAQFQNNPTEGIKQLVGQYLSDMDQKQTKENRNRPIELPWQKKQEQGNSNIQIPYREGYGMTADVGLSKDAQARREEMVPLFQQAATEQGIDWGILDFIARAELNYNKGTSEAEKTSWAGAKGPMQFIDSTAREYGVDVWDTASSVNGAAKYIKKMLVKYDGDVEKAVASYNCGPGNVDQAIKEAEKSNKTWQELIPAETKLYIANWKKWTGKKTKEIQETQVSDEDYLKQFEVK